MRPWLVLGLALSVPPAAAAAQNATTETVEQALCRLVENAASEHRVPVDFFTRLIWQESTFRPGVTSRAGAQGIAQFMPQTARERGLADPFDPEQAIPKAAELLAELRQRFGNLGLAAAAYNGGPNRVASWLAGEGELPAETRAYVAIVTRRSVDEWRPTESGGAAAEPMPDTGAPSPSCLEMTALLRRPGREAPEELTPFAPWGVQLAGNFSKERALATFDRARRRVAAVIEDERPMVIGTRLRYRGTRTFYRVRVPAQTRQAATVLCNRIRAAGGSCVVLPS
jgi:hypothetical protein